jgi:hypothetical protein
MVPGLRPRKAPSASSKIMIRTQSAPDATRFRGGFFQPGCIPMDGEEEQ